MAISPDAGRSDDAATLARLSSGALGGPGDREAAGRDFGNLLRGASSAVVAPRSTEELVELVRLANARDLLLTPRGLGLSQGGQSLSNGRVSVDLSRLDRVEAPVVPADGSSLGTIRCGGGATWRAVLRAAAPHGMVPLVTPLNPDLTVGGTLSVGCIGSSTHAFGPGVAQVASLEVVTGSGDRVECSPEREPDLFESVLAGLGRVGVIAAATLRLRRARASTRTFYLLYDSAERWLADQRALVAAGAPHLEAFCTPCPQGFRDDEGGRRSFAEWFYRIEASFEHDGEPPRAEQALAGLAPLRVVHCEDKPTTAFPDRYAPRFAWMRRSGALHTAHPWVEALLPGDAVLSLLPRVLATLPLGLGETPRVFFVGSQARARRFFMTPPAGEIIGVAITPGVVPPHLQDETLDAMRSIHALLCEAGGVRYLSGWLEMMSPAAWRAHFGDRFEEWHAAKRRFDPRGVLGSLLLDQVLQA